jgi:hypothetical protein
MGTQSETTGNHLAAETGGRGTRASVAPHERRRTRLIAAAISLSGGLFLSCCVVAVSPILWDTVGAFFRSSRAAEPTPHAAKSAKSRASVEKSIGELHRKCDRLVPHEPFLIVNTADNLFVLMKGETVIRKGVCSTGKYVLLRSADQREWVFKTPRGAFKILGKVESPVWTMPDWAFVEEGKPIPPANSSERMEAGVLGDYALSLGQGYMIHGTLYQRYLGLPVTHGCVRLGDADLEAVYENLRIGSRVFIY